MSTATSSPKSSPRKPLFLAQGVTTKDFFEDLRRRRAIHGRSVFLRPHVVAHVPGTENPQHTFERAVAWLHSMSVVGLTERFEETQQLMADLIGVPPPRQSLIANVNPSRNDLRQTYRAAIAPEMLAYLEEINHYDLALYAVAVDLFEQKWVHFARDTEPLRCLSPRGSFSASVQADADLVVGTARRCSSARST